MTVHNKTAALNAIFRPETPQNRYPHPKDQSTTQSCGGNFAIGDAESGGRGNAGGERTQPETNQPPLDRSNIVPSAGINHAASWGTPTISGHSGCVTTGNANHHDGAVSAPEGPFHVRCKGRIEYFRAQRSVGSATKLYLANRRLGCGYRIVGLGNPSSLAEAQRR